MYQTLSFIPVTSTSARNRFIHTSCRQYYVPPKRRTILSAPTETLIWTAVAMQYCKPTQMKSILWFFPAERAVWAGKSVGCGLISTDISIEFFVQFLCFWNYGWSGSATECPEAVGALKLQVPFSGRCHAAEGSMQVQMSWSCRCFEVTGAFQRQMPCNWRFHAGTDVLQL